MSDEINHTTNTFIAVIAWTIKWTIYLAFRTLYLLKVLVPVWFSRLSSNLAFDLDIAHKVYNGTNIHIMHVDPVPEAQKNNYYRRYDGTTREAA